MNLSKDIALLVFSNTVIKDSREKELSSNLRVNMAVHKQLFAKTIATARKSKLPYFVLTNHNQKGITFGERISNAIQEVYDKGYQKVIVIGGDTPDLNNHIISDAQLQLKNHTLVFGPSVDGGVFLIGIDRNVFNKEKFQELDWRKQSLQYSIQQFCNEIQQDVVWLNELQDIDSKHDLIYFLNMTNLSFFKIRLLLLFKEIKIYSVFLIHSYSILNVRILLLRGPPSSI